MQYLSRSYSWTRLALVAFVFGLVSSLPIVSLSRRCGIRKVAAKSPTALLVSNANPTDGQAIIEQVEDRHTRAQMLSRGDPDVDAPLPPAYTACPFTGIVGGTQSFFRVASKALQSPSMFSFVSKNEPMIEVSGGSLVRRLLNQEFTALTSNAVVGISQIACGTESLRTARDPAQHRALRDLVSVPLSPAAVQACIPRLQAISQQRIDELAKPGVVIRAIELTRAMALDITWQQVLGLNFKTADEIDTFHQYTYQWLRGMYSKPESPPFQAMLSARKYLVKAIEGKIEELLLAGHSDGSTVGGLVYATLEDVNGEADGEKDQTQRLSKQEVIDNALLLILAATETTSSNLANSILLMGLHPDVWEKIVDEQIKVTEKHGEEITKEILADDCPHLDAVIQETLRILPVTLISRRQASKTLVLDNQQIPKGWGVSYNIFLTHQRDPSVTWFGAEDPMDLVAGFRPSRWLDPATRPTNLDYIPFGAGPRKCPGIFLAKTEMKTFLAVFARSVRYKLARDIDPNQPIDSQIVWEQRNTVPIPEDGVEIRIL